MNIIFDMTIWVCFLSSVKKSKIKSDISSLHWRSGWGHDEVRRRTRVWDGFRRRCANGCQVRKGARTFHAQGLETTRWATGSLGSHFHFFTDLTQLCYLRTRKSSFRINNWVTLIMRSGDKKEKTALNTNCSNSVFPCWVGAWLSALGNTLKLLYWNWKLC